jgi:hypothetical protein
MSGVRFWGRVLFLGALVAPTIAIAETLWTHIPDLNRAGFIGGARHAVHVHALVSP